ncbi:hypothetical protein BD410DRAFT_734381 [Rickenella mellea]|uniref:DUF659 domain-containing protein n=1 Tax=Rickenella mellea TaxID=50990 RepID=A0A4Y7PGV1_9AGAM|nr:hypothetical protein BD410DRAFT_734381 [Rickenella mellea]
MTSPDSEASDGYETVPDEGGDGFTVATGAKGRPRDEDLDKICKEVYNEANPAKPRWGCVGEGCGWLQTNRNRARMLKHANRCTYLSPRLKMFAAKMSGSNSLGKQVAKIEAGATIREVKDGGTEVEDVGPNTRQLAKHGGKHGSFIAQSFKASTAVETQIKLDFAVILFLCCAGIPPSITSRPEWKNLWKIANSSYHPQSCDTIVDREIPAEAANVRLLQLKHLQTQTNLTITFDGGGTRRKQSFYTVHITTDDRRVFFVEGHCGDNASHTIEWLVDMLLEIMDRVGRERFAGVCSDSTGNTKGCRRELCRLVPTLINLPDPAHHTNLAVKDICALEFFKSVIADVRATIKAFKQSDKSSKALTDAKKGTSTGRGLESIGKTRFATICHSAESVRRNSDLIRDCIESGAISIKTDKIFARNSTSSTMFALRLNQLIDVTMPLAQAIKCLESSHSTAANVYLFWLAITSALKDVLSNPDSGLPDDVKSDIRGIINYRFSELLEDGPTSVHLAAFYLDPRYVHSAVLKEPNPLAFTIRVPATKPKASDANKPPIANVKVFKRVGQYLGSVLEAEVKNGINPSLVAPGLRSSIKRDFMTQFEAYARLYWPFNAPLAKGQTVFSWWENLLLSPHASLLATIAVKIYAMVPNSMADERTASTFTWMNSALRNRQELGTITDMAQIRQHYQAGLKVRISYV